MESENVDLIAFGYKTLGDTTLAMVSQNIEDSTFFSEHERNALIEKSLDYLNKAGRYYERSQKWMAVLEVFKQIELAGSLIEENNASIEKNTTNNDNNNDNDNKNENEEEKIEDEKDSNKKSSHNPPPHIKYRKIDVMKNAQENIAHLEALILENKRSTSLGTNVSFENYDYGDGDGYENQQRPPPSAEDVAMRMSSESSSMGNETQGGRNLFSSTGGEYSRYYGNNNENENGYHYQQQ